MKDRDYLQVEDFKDGFKLALLVIYMCITGCLFNEWNNPVLLVLFIVEIAYYIKLFLVYFDKD